jgi:hypothetical protein
MINKFFWLSLSLFCGFILGTIAAEPLKTSYEKAKKEYEFSRASKLHLYNRASPNR